MKTSTLFTTLLISATLLFNRCTPDYESLDNTREIISAGTWKVDLFYMGQDQTSLYTQYRFAFRNNGSLEVTGSPDTLSGSWDLIRDIDNREVVRINLPTSYATLQQLNAMWSITGKEFERLSMTDRNGSTADFRIRKE